MSGQRDASGGRAGSDSGLVSGAEPLRPLASDEEPHTRAADALWNESWYFDFAAPELGMGGWVRLGLYPNEKQAWINALLCGPGMPTIAVNDFEAHVPEDPAHVRTADLTLTQQAVEPLLTYRVGLTGRGRAYDDPSALLRGEDGRPAQVSLDLVWSSVGTPYQYRVTTRYEIPCTVSGSVTVDGTTLSVDAAVGQRDHSWGVRDWWSMDWLWSALHLDDGTHVHAVDIRIPGAPRIGLGYLQPAGGALVELEAVEAREVFGANGLPISTELTVRPGDLVLHADVVAHAPVRLVSGDGRVAQFPRAWVSVTAADGRTGTGWVEWNRNRPDLS